MNAVELHLPDGRPSGLWCCANCKYTTRHKIHADQCCVCRVCGKSKDWTTANLECPDCLAKRWARNARDKMERAEKLDDWPGWVCADGDRYFDSLDAYVEHLECEGIDPADWPEFVYIAEPMPFPELDLVHVLENLCDGWGEDFDFETDLRGVKELGAAIEAFNAANKGVSTLYYAFEEKAVRVPRRDVTTEVTS